VPEASALTVVEALFLADHHTGAVAHAQSMEFVALRLAHPSFNSPHHLFCTNIYMQRRVFELKPDQGATAALEFKEDKFFFKNIKITFIDIIFVGLNRKTLLISAYRLKKIITFYFVELTCL